MAFRVDDQAPALAGGHGRVRADHEYLVEDGIGLHLEVSTQTVKVFRRQLYAKCNISSQAELFALLMPLFARLTEHG